jgi:hypothetical protein
MRLQKYSHDSTGRTPNNCVHEDLCRSIGARDEHVIGAAAIEEKPGDPKN